MMNKEDMLKKLADCVCDMEDEEIVDAVQEYLAAGYDPQEGLAKERLLEMGMM